MPRPTNKEQLLKVSDENYNKLLQLVDSIPDEYKEKEFKNNELNERDRTIADVIMHLYEWHLMMENWYKVGMAGEKPAIPGEGYTWRTLPAFNREIWKKYKGTKLKDALNMLEKSHKTMMTLINKHSNEDLFTKAKYKWTGNNSLGAYLIGSTSSHYDWAIKTIKPILKLGK